MAVFAFIFFWGCENPKKVILSDNEQNDSILTDEDDLTDLDVQTDDIVDNDFDTAAVDDDPVADEDSAIDSDNIIDEDTQYDADSDADIDTDSDLIDEDAVYDEDIMDEDADADTDETLLRTFTCENLPANAQWNTVDSYEQIWTGTAWLPADSAATFSTTPSTTECRFICNDSYFWNGSMCESDAKVFMCADKPANSEWNSVSSYNQIWNGTAWVPADSETLYNETSSTTECHFKCSEFFTWNIGSGTCEGNTQTFTCADKPAIGTIWNSVSSFTQVWTGSAWSPADSITSYNTSASDTECRYTCAENYTWNGSVCVADTKTFNCADKPANSVWNNTSSYNQTWNGTSWIPADSVTTYNIISSSTECRFDCDLNYTWDGADCVASTKLWTCPEKPAAGTEYNTVMEYLQTWTGFMWDPADDSDTNYNPTPTDSSCQYKCAVNYTWDGSNCVANTKPYPCADKPANSEWNTVSSFTQTWNGTAWLPADDPSTDYNTAASTTECRFKCSENYSWNGSACVADIRNFICADKPVVGTLWNAVPSYIQTWNGTAWSPADSATEYNTASSTTACHYVCAPNYTWNGSVCVANTQTYSCTALSVGNSMYNTVGSYTQTWNGVDWVPAADTVLDYNVTPSTTECRFKCKDNYTWNGSACIANTQTFTCAAKPSTGTEWNTVSSYTQTWNGTAWSPADSVTTYNAAGSAFSCRYSCAVNYTWNGSVCVANTRTFDCTAKTGGSTTAYNTVSSYTQTWNGSAWIPVEDTITEYNPTPSATSCQYTCAENYSWDGSACVFADRIYTCPAKPAVGTEWNLVDRYAQTWNGTAWVPADDASTDYGTTPTVTECRYKCAANYTWNGSSCAPDTQTFTCAAKPVNSEWNTVSSYTQTWNGTAWAPADSVTTFNATGSSTECRFKCLTNYTWNGSACVADTQTFNCVAKPATGTEWNTVSSYTQTWNGSAWVPADTTTAYSTTGSTTACRYKCATNYTWNGSVCVANTRTFTCAAKPGSSTTVWNTVSSYTQTWNGTAWAPADSVTAYNATSSSTECRYTCAVNYTWNSSSSTCVADTRIYTCPDLPEAGTVYNTVGVYAQTWSGSAWLPADDPTTEYNTTASNTECRYICAPDYHRYDGACVSNTRTYSCAAKPGTKFSTVYNTVSSYTQTWVSGTTYTPADDPLTDYNTVSSTTSCRYKCGTGYAWNGTACINTRTYTCAAKPGGSSTVYNTVSSYTQNLIYSDLLHDWIWSPRDDSTTDYNETETTTACRYKCAANYTWDGTACVAEKRQIGSATTDDGSSVYTDSLGNTYVAGTTLGDFDGHVSSGGADALLVKWNADGTKAWSRQWGSTADDYAKGVAVDSTGNIYVTGRTGGTLSGATSLGGIDAFLTKFNSSGALQWNAQVGSTLADYGAGVAINNANDVFITGYQNTASNGYDVFVAKWFSNGTYSTKKVFGTSSNDVSYSIKIDSTGNSIITGYTAGSMNGTNQGGSDAFVLKIAADMTTVTWAKQLGTAGTDIAKGVDFDSSDNIYITGYSNGAFDGQTNAGNYDVFVTKYSNSGTKQWTTLFGTANADYGYTIDVDSSGNILVAGGTYGSFNGYTNAGSADAFMSKLDSVAGVANWTKQFGTALDEEIFGISANSTSVAGCGYTTGTMAGSNAGGPDMILITTPNN